MEGARFTGVDTHDSNGTTMNFERNAQHGDNTFLLGRCSILETAVSAYIWYEDGRTLEGFTIQGTTFHVDRPFRQITAAQAVHRAHLQLPGAFIKQTQRTGFDLHCLGYTCDDTL